MNKFFLLLHMITLCAVLSAQSTTISFRVTVEKLRLRAAPDKNAAVIAELPEHTQMVYLDQTSGTWDEVTLRNQPHKARWYKVHPSEKPQQVGWVYGGAVALSSVYMANDADLKVPVLHYDFLELEQVTSQQYQAVFNAYHNPMQYDTVFTLYHTNDSTLVLPIKNGTQHTLVSGGLEEDMQEYYYEGQLPDIHTYLVRANYYEYEEVILIDQNTGRRVATEGFPGELPQLSPDKQWLAQSWSNIYENNGGLQLLAVLPDGVYAAALFAIENMYFEGACWDAQGRIYFRSYHWSDSENNKVHQYHRLTLTKR